MTELIAYLPPALFCAVGLYRMLKWAKVVKTWHKSIGVVVGYYMRTGMYGEFQRISFENLLQIEKVHKWRRTPNEPSHHFAAIIKYQYGQRFFESAHSTDHSETLPYAPNEELLVYIDPTDHSQIKIGDNIAQLWHPFLLFMIGIVASGGILAWQLSH